MDNGLINVEVEPCVGRHVVAGLCAAGAPAVFDLPAVRLAGRFVDVHAGDAHGVVHLAGVVVQHIFLGHGSVKAGQSRFVVLVNVPARLFAVVVLAAVGAEPNDFALIVFAVGELLDNECLEFVHFEVQIAYVRAADHVAEVLDGVRLVEGLVFRRSMDDADVIVKVIADIGFKELQRSHITDGDDLAVLVLVFEIEFLRGNIVAGAEEGVGLFEHFRTESRESVGFTGSSEPAEFGGLCTEVVVDVLVDVAGVGGLEGFRIAYLREDTVLLHDVDEHIPLTAVMYAGADDVVNHAGIVRFVCGVDHACDVVVDAFELIKECQIGLGKFKGIHVQLLRDDFAEDVGCGKEPAAAAGHLVGRGHGLDVGGEEELVLLCVLGGERHVVHVGLCEDAGERASYGVVFVISFVAVDIITGDGYCVFHLGFSLWI